MFNWKKCILNILWVIISVLLIIGFSSPMFTFSHFYFFNDTFSLAKGVFHLAKKGEYILFILLFTFSLLMPVIKMLMLFYTINAFTIFNHIQQRRLDKLATMSKWSMLDVYVIAILAVTIKLGMVATVHIHFGMIAFALSVVFSMLLTWLISYFYKNLFSKEHQKKDHNVVVVLNKDSVTIILCMNQLAQLLNQGNMNINHIGCSDLALVDIVDTNGLWRAKAQYKTTTLSYLSLIAKR